MTSDFETDKTGKILTGYHGNSTCINVPEGIVIVASDAFINSNITSVLFPASLKFIGFHAFENSISLQSVVLPNLSARIMDGAFSGCSKLADENGFVIINHHLIEYFGDNVDVRIPDGVTDIQSKAFEDKGINSIYIPGSVKEGVSSVRMAVPMKMGSDNMNDGKPGSPRITVTIGLSRNNLLPIIMTHLSKKPPRVRNRLSISLISYCIYGS